MKSFKVNLEQPVFSASVGAISLQSLFTRWSSCLNVLISSGIANSHHPGLYRRCQRILQPETCYNKTFATQNKHHSIFFVRFYIENTLPLKYWKQNKMWSNYSDSERGYLYTPTLRKRWDTLMNILSFMWISVLTEVKTEGTDSSAVAASTMYCKRRDHVCIVTLGLSASKHVAVKHYVLYWGGDLQLDRDCGSVFLYFHIQIWLCSLSYVEFRGLLHAHISIANWFARACLVSQWRPNGHQICCHPSFRLNLICWKRRWNSAVFAFACYYWVIILPYHTLF